MLADIHSWVPMVSVQNHYHMMERQAEEEMLPYCAKHGVGFIPFFPVGRWFF